MRTGQPRLVATVAAVAIACVLVAATSAVAGLLLVGPHRPVLPDGRRLAPDGHLVPLGGNFTHGAAITPDGRFAWTVSAGEGIDDVRIVALGGRHPHLLQILRLPGASGGLAIARDGTSAYVAGEPAAGERPVPDVPASAPGHAGDVIHVFTIDRRSGRARETGVISVTPPAGTRPPEDFPPTRTAPQGWPQDVAISGDGRTLLVALSLADSAAVIDLASRRVRFVATGSFPYGAAILPDGRTGLVSNEGPGTVSVIDLAAATKTGDITVGPPLSHPEGIAVDPRGGRAFVALANTDTVAVLDTRRLTLAASVPVGHPQGPGVSPIALSVLPGSRRLLVADAGGEDIAVVGLPGLSGPGTGGAGAQVATDPAAYPVLGRIPTAWYPVAAFGLSRPRRLVWVSAEGFGLGPNVHPVDPRYADSAERERGVLAVAPVPSARALARLTRVADGVLHPVGEAAAPADTPLRPDGPIKHVFYIVRENRNYDQVLGDLPQGDGDPALTLFGEKVTPNLHALARRFGLLDDTMADSEVSIDGHWWTSGAQATDFVERNNHPSNAGRNYPYDFVYSIAAADRGSLFAQAQQQGISYMNFGEGISDLLPVPDKDRTPADTALSGQVFAHTDLGAPSGCYPNDADIGKDAITGRATFDSSLPAGAPPLSESRFDCFRSKFEAQLATDSVPALTYLTTVDDHTQGTTPGQRTPTAMVATSDLGLGQIVDLISHSPIWPSSAIFVVEDDSQEGLDHVDAHRMPAFVISPYSRPGAVVSAHYDQLSVIRSIELICGLRPLTLNDALAAPMYQAFGGTPDLTPYTAITPSVSLTQLNTAAAPNARRSARLPWGRLDAVAPGEADRILWQSVHGAGSTPPLVPRTR